MIVNQVEETGLMEGLVMVLLSYTRLRVIVKTHPGRISTVRNVETLMRSGRESGTARPASTPPAKAAEHRRRNGWPKKRRLAAERQRETITGQIGRCPRRKAADVGQVNHPKNAVRMHIEGEVRCKTPALQTEPRGPPNGTASTGARPIDGFAI